MIIGGWTIFAILSVAFQCTSQLPKSWLYEPTRCYQGGLEYAVVALNLVTDAYLAIFFIPTVWALHMHVSKRVLVAGLFLSRLLSVPQRSIIYRNMLMKPGLAPEKWHN
jgi:hypothetical protein